MNDLTETAKMVLTRSGHGHIFCSVMPSHSL